MKRDQWIVALAAGAVTLLAAAYTVFGVGMQMSALEMTRMARPVGEPMPMGPGRGWTAGYALLVFLMWWVMMVAMMIPSAAPTLLLYTALKRTGPDAARAAWLCGVFLFGYLACWAVFSALATGLQWLLSASPLMNAPMMSLHGKGMAGAVLLLAGLYQFSPLKQACLRHCRAPAQFLARHHRPGAGGALGLGLRHGVYCLGCCWALMALLFVGGIMNLWWVAGLAVWVLVEKAAPHGVWLTLAGGAVLILWGGWLLLAG
ncbi:hypothetical protein PSA7680_02217 [Pseudoruegeria aquimaris]|uniref:Metal-binding integral membrane protein n=1 Tax=Pseudoruegeria aquimaris TaxID=393663 RepID=A0A1Y5SMY6_9RHOB|nr:hypothetical protein PSA7680_02217 [Pseudoruegeria aquimaris]